MSNRPPHTKPMQAPIGPDPGKNRKPGIMKAPHPIIAPNANAHMDNGDIFFSKTGRDS